MCAVDVDGGVGASAGERAVAEPLEGEHFLLLSLDVLEREAAAHVPDFEGAVVRARGEVEGQLAVESDRARPLRMRLECLSRLCWRALVPKADLTVLVRGENK